MSCNKLIEKRVAGMEFVIRCCANLELIHVKTVWRSLSANSAESNVPFLHSIGSKVSSYGVVQVGLNKGGEHFKPGARKSRGVVHLIGWPRNGT
jgi:hypothetical protein